MKESEVLSNLCFLNDGSYACRFIFTEMHCKISDVDMLKLSPLGKHRVRGFNGL